MLWILLRLHLHHLLQYLYSNLKTSYTNQAVRASKVEAGQLTYLSLVKEEAHGCYGLTMERTYNTTPQGDVWMLQEIH